MHEALVRLNFSRDVAQLTPHLLKVKNWIINEIACPLFDLTIGGQRPLRLKMDCSDWDELPPAALLLSASGDPISDPMPGGVFNGGPHPSRGGPFICMRGFREYHTHSSHLTDYWETYRGQDGMNLLGLIDQVSRAWRKAYGT